MLTHDRRFLSAQDLEEIQGLVIWGTHLPLLRYHFLEVRDPGGARGLLNSFLSGDLSITSAGVRNETQERADYRLYVGLTALGLRALGQSTESLQSFPEEFRQGARARAASVGDVGASAPEHWVLNHDRVHIAVLLYAANAEAQARYSTLITERAEAGGCQRVTIENYAFDSADGEILPDLHGGTEQHIHRPVHFNFRDGLSQPSLMGITKHGVEVEPGPPPVPPGTFVLGHPYKPDDPGKEPSHSLSNEPVPEPYALGHNGTYGAFRMLEQDCDAFEQFLDRNANGSSQDRELLAAKMCGRWRNGRPLTLAPYSPSPAPGNGEILNDFDYRPSPLHPNAIDDGKGVLCPVGSHIRRSNPRSADVLGQVGNRIRLVRRGMPYGPPHTPGDGKKRGMLGLFLCVSLKHQFEFIQRHWINDGLFARNLPPAERDPLVGHQEPGAVFTYPSGVDTPRPTGLQSFVTTKAAAYLFFPSVSGIRHLASVQESAPLPAPGAGAGLQLSEEDRVDAVVADMLRRLGKSPRRDAHPKHHGVVRAVFEVSNGLPTGLAHGLFAKHDKYQAYVRFSNGSPRLRLDGTLQPDAAPDTRGMGIKLLGVQGPKLLDDERLTHDFVLATHPVFFTRDLGEYLRFLATPTKDLERSFPLLFASFQMHDSPLSAGYFSQTPYALGPTQVVKYVAVPVVPELTPQPFNLGEHDPRRTQPNFLREALAAHLRTGEAIFDFHVQFKPEGANEDDAVTLWEGDLHRVARLTIPLQEFTSVRQDLFAENLSMNPWHCLEAHRPRGSINLARRAVYLTASRTRHRNSGEERREPDGVNDF